MAIRSDDHRCTTGPSQTGTSEAGRATQEGHSSENTYDDAGRVVRQVAHLEPSPDRPQPQDAIIALAYTVTAGGITVEDRARDRAEAIFCALPS